MYVTLNQFYSSLFNKSIDDFFFCLVMRKGIVLFVFANTTNELVSKTVNDANK